ncbi:transglycosylase SLT domain-containing protein [Lyticum sinuosum]|uniref:transglycosylase SLT domain-containing protein n=1 Tax=Lyticum sinuosum TaxID=1332059 RepID=UPI002ACE6015|nr:transglycosylase SLT domain-containing protein [Lyticum sinuosum]
MITDERYNAYASYDIYGDHWQCISAIKFYEKKYSLPKNLLYSISIVESGYNYFGNKDPLPWPWTINALGKSHYFKNKQQALNYLKRLLDAGHTNIDIGCTQINWIHHKHQFGNSPNNILNPIYNVAYAAHYLTERYISQKNWKKAIGQYHSFTPHLSSAYSEKVYKRMSELGSNISYRNPHNSNYLYNRYNIEQSLLSNENYNSNNRKHKQSFSQKSQNITNKNNNKSRDISEPMMIATNINHRIPDNHGISDNHRMLDKHKISGHNYITLPKN